MGKGYALIYWIHSKRSDIVKCTTIPKKCRKDGAVITLKWTNTVTDIVERRPAKVVKIAKSKMELSNLSVDPDTGTLNQIEKKLTTRNPIVKRSDMLFAARKAMKIKIAKQKEKRQSVKKSNKAVFTYLNDDDESDSSSDSSSDDEITNDPLDLENANQPEQQLQKLLSTVTIENINFLKRLVALMEQTYERQQIHHDRQEAIISEPDPAEIIDQDKVNIHSSLGGFLPPMTITAIFHRNQDLSDWKKLVTDILVEIYGKQLAYLSAKGRRGAQGIDPNVYRAVYDLVNTRLGWIVPAKDFVRHINKVCSNRKKYVRTKKDANELIPATIQEQTLPPANEPVFNAHEDVMQFPNNSYCPLEISETFSQAHT